MASYIVLGKNEKDTTITFDFEIDKKAWLKTQDAEIIRYASRVKMPGFRPGKAPINAIKKAVHPQEYIQAAANKQINDTIRDFSETTPETNFIGASPKVEVKQANEHTLVFSATFEKMPTVKIADYKTFDIKLMDEKVTNEEVQHEFDRMVKKDVMLTNKDDGTVENGDSVNIDFTGYLNDKKFPGGSSKNYDLVIGSNSFIPGFEEQIIGMKNGEEKDILVTFPKDYHSTDLAGKETKFVVKVNSIHSVSYPTFNKEYFSKFKLPGITNESEFKEYLKKQLVDWKKYKIEEDFQKQISEKIIQTTELSFFPELLIKNEEHKIEHETDKLAQKAGATKEEYLKSLGYSNDELYKDGLRKTAERNVKFVCALEKIASELKIDVTEHDFDDYFEKVSKLYNVPLKDIKNQYKKNLTNIEAFIFQKKTFQTLQTFYTK